MRERGERGVSPQSEWASNFWSFAIYFEFLYAFIFLCCLGFFVISVWSLVGGSFWYWGWQPGIMPIVGGHVDLAPAVSCSVEKCGLAVGEVVGYGSVKSA